MTRPSDSTEDKGNTLGLPMPNVEVKIIDPETGKTVPPGTDGEFCTRGYHVMHEYYRNPEATAAAIDADGWLHTGDLGRIDDDGYLWITGRSKDMIIRGGENIAPAEIEDVLVEHPAVHDCAVVGPEDPQWGQIIVAVVVPAADADPDPDELREHVRSQLRGSRTPDRVVFRTELPTNATGKVLRRELVEEYTRSRT
jgi:acyl-CoA synthetase (AMP-forming)/AMP-acid ligase II